MTASETAPDILDELHRLLTFFETARAELGKEVVVDVKGMDKQIAALCERVQKSGAIVQKQCLPELSKLIFVLNEYEKDLRQYQALMNARNDEQKDAPHD